MPYTYQGWTLYSRDVKLKKGPKVTIYFFSKRKPKSGKPMDEMPVQSREPHPPRQNGGGPRPFSLSVRTSGGGPLHATYAGSVIGTGNCEWRTPQHVRFQT